MQETDTINRKLADQQIDYFKIAKILISRWYWIAGSVIIAESAREVERTA